MLVGREYEKQFLLSLIETTTSELVAVYGRRRIGKTFLIKEVYKELLCFEFTGTQQANIKNQLFKFYEKINDHFRISNGQTAAPTNWREAFSVLKNCIQKTNAQKPVIFFDEVPWIASKRSDFLEEFSYWWNDWASKQNMVVVICGSAASWMLKKVINQKGGLHNRVTKRMNLKPFTLAETKLYLEQKNIHWDYFQTLQFYMTVGGVPTYLNEVIQGESAAQAINRIFFGEDSFMLNEFENLYAALFDNHQNYIDVIKALAEKQYGLTRNDIIRATKLSDGGGLTQILSELEASSFITKMVPFNKQSKDAIFRLCDEYSLFYLKFLTGKVKNSKNEWLRIAASQAYSIWCGYAFENCCIKHIESIKMALGISGIQTAVSGYFLKGNEQEKGFQIDLLIERADNTLNICEMKFSNDDYVLTELYAEALRKRREAFKRITKTKKLLFNTLITTYGLNQNKSLQAQIDQVITMDKLFELKRF